MRPPLTLAGTACVAALLLLPAAATASTQTARFGDSSTDQDDPGKNIEAVSVGHDTAAGTRISVLLEGTPASLPADARLSGVVGVSDGAGNCTARVLLFVKLKPADTGSGGTTFDDAGTQTPVTVTKAEGGAAIDMTTTAVRPGGGIVDCAFVRVVGTSPETGEAEIFDQAGPFDLDDDTPPPPPPPRTTPTPTPRPPAPTTPATPPPPPTVPAAPEGTPAYSLSGKVPSLARAKRSYVYGICRFSICRIDPVTRKSARVQRSPTEKGAYDAVSTSRDGGTMAFRRNGTIFRAGRDGRNRADYGAGYAPTVRPDGRAVAWYRFVQIANGPRCSVNFFGGALDCNYLTGSTTRVSLEVRGLGAKEAKGHSLDPGSYAWSRDVLLGTDEPKESRAGFVCALDVDGRCAKTVAQDATQKLSAPQVTSDGRYVVVVSEPAPPNDETDAKSRGSIVLYNPTTGAKLRQLTTSTRDTNPMFSPDGKQVAFNRGEDVLVVPLKGGRPKLVARDVKLTGPSWSLAR